MSQGPRTARRMKRLFDILVAVGILILAAPVLLLVALAIKLDSPGPILFRQTRVGQHGRSIDYIKFRTMVVDALETGTAPMSKWRNDPRISRIGRFLRATSIDELPMLLNVLKGDMSIVGPRAALPLEADHYSELQRRRLELKPGITGYWQVFGREAGAASATDFQKMVEMDLEYADKQSISLDLKILLRAFVVASRREAAY
jgi:lipopolysaccharide/colanic/teichoic acid biosynthesis glycosyltransferase